MKTFSYWIRHCVATIWFLFFGFRRKMSTLCFCLVRFMSFISENKVIMELNRRTQQTVMAFGFTDKMYANWCALTNLQKCVHITSYYIARQFYVKIHIDRRNCQLSGTQ